MSTEGFREIEHRYLLSELPSNLADEAFTIAKVKNAYLNTATISERFTRRRYIRHPKYEVGTKLYRRTVKVGHGLERFEFKDECERSLYQEMWESPHCRRLRKTRFRIMDGELLWEVDTFNDRKLLLAEVEVPSAEFKFKTPKWLASCIVREVTSELAYEGAQLAK